MTKQDKKDLVSAIAARTARLESCLQRVPNRVLEAGDVRVAQNWKAVVYKATFVINGRRAELHERPGKLRDKLAHINYLIEQLA